MKDFAKKLQADPVKLRKLAPQLYQGDPLDVCRKTALNSLPPEPRPQKPIRQSDKPLLNGLETQWKYRLQDKYPHVTIYEQALKFRISRSAFYKPDLTAWIDGVLHCWECKGLSGKNVDRGKLALKVAASQYPEIKWFIVWKPKGCEFEIQEVLP